MTGPRGDFTPEFQTLGARRPRKDEIKPEPPASVPAPGIHAANAQKDPADWPFGEDFIFNHH